MATDFHGETLRIAIIEDADKPPKKTRTGKGRFKPPAPSEVKTACANCSAFDQLTGRSGVCRRTLEPRLLQDKCDKFALPRDLQRRVARNSKNASQGKTRK